MGQRMSVPGDVPRKVVFFIELPEQIPVPHGSTLSRILDIHVPEYEYSVTRIVDRLPYTEVENEKGGLIVSIRFWQPLVPVDNPLSDALDQVIHAILPERLFKDHKRVDHPIPRPTTCRSIVDAVTLLLPADGDARVSKAFDRCLELIGEYGRIYQRSTANPIGPLSYERMPYIIPYITSDLNEPPSWDPGLSLLQLHFNLPSDIITEPVDQETMDKFHTHLHRHVRQDPIPAYVDAMFRARHAFEKVGDYGSAVIHAYIAAEVFLDIVLALLLWEERVEDPESAAIRIFKDRTVRRAKLHFKDRIGGNWSTVGGGAVGRWVTVLGALRHRVVHMGYWPTKDEAAEAIDVMNELTEFVKDRLCARRNSYPLSALLMLGIPGLERRGGWTSKMQRFVDEHKSDPDWIISFADWKTRFDASRPN